MEEWCGGMLNIEQKLEVIACWMKLVCVCLVLCVRVGVEYANCPACVSMLSNRMTCYSKCVFYVYTCVYYFLNDFQRPAILCVKVNVCTSVLGVMPVSFLQNQV